MDVTIHFTPEQANVLRAGLIYELGGETDNLNRAANNLSVFDPHEQRSDLELERFQTARTVVDELTAFLDIIGWQPSDADSWTVDEDWLREFLYMGMDRAAQNLHESDTEHFRSRLEIVLTYKEMLDQIGWGEPSKAELVAS